MANKKNTRIDNEMRLDHPMKAGLRFELVDVTPALAKEWLTRNQGNRRQRDNVISAYVRDINADAWMVTGETVKFDWHGRLIDGQHRLEACIRSGKTISTFVVWGLDPEVQLVLDVNARRTAADALRFAGVDVQAKDIASIARVHSAYKSGVLKTALDPMSNLSMTNNEVIEWHQRNPDVEHAAAFASKIARGIGSTPAGLGAAVLELLRIDAEATIQFLSSAAELRTDGAGDPRKAMLDAFANIRRDRRAPSAAETLNIVFRAWNARHQAKQLRIIRSGASDHNGGVAGVSIPAPVGVGEGAAA